MLSCLFRKIPVFKFDKLPGRFWQSTIQKSNYDGWGELSNFIQNLVAGKVVDDILLLLVYFDDEVQASKDQE